MILYNWTQLKEGLWPKVFQERHESVIIIELKNIWPEIIGGQKLN